MALVARIKSVEYLVTATDSGGVTSSVDLSLSGELVALGTRVRAARVRTAGLKTKTGATIAIP